MIKFLVKSAVSVLLLWLLLRNVDTAEILRHLSSVSPDWLAAATVLLASLSLVQTLRWITVIRALGERMTFRTALTNIWIGLFFNQTLPSSIGGDAVRMWRAYKADLTLAAAVNGVILDRLVALAALIIVTAAGTPAFFDLLGDSPIRWTLPAIAVGGVFGFAVLFVFDRLPAPLFRWRLLRGGARLSSDTRRLFLQPRFALPTIAMSLVNHVGVAMVVFLLATALAIDVGVVDCLILVPPVILFSMIPISIAGWGLREGAMITAFGLVAVPSEQAFALSVLFGVVVMAIGLPGGLVWLLSGGGKAEALSVPGPAAAGSAEAGVPR